MERLIKLCVWTGERVLETTLITLAIMVTERPSKGVGGGGVIEEYFRTMNFPILFYGFSGYILSCICFGMIFRSSSLVKHTSLFAAAFLCHLGLFSFIAAGDIARDLIEVGIYGVIVVVLSNATGAFVFNKFLKKRGS